MALFKRRKQNKICVIGLDGLPYSLLRQFAASGVMPRMKGIIDEGYLTKMKVTLPEISAVSWPSFMTGTNPGTHGIFGFADLKPGSYSMRFPSYRDLKAPTIWDEIGEKGKISIVINQPSTYPARRIKGILISGFVALELEKAVSPSPYLTVLEKLGYEIDIDTFKAREDPDYCLDALEKCLSAREKVAKFLFKNEEWDYFELVITGTDRIQHFLWYAMEDENNPRHKRVIDFYKQVDEVVGNFYSMFMDKAGGGAGNFFMLSDHGFTGIKKELQLNAWLAQEGYLRFTADNPESLEQIEEGSIAFALDPGRIYINMKNKFPKGCVEKGTAEAVKAELKQRLLNLEYEGEPVIDKVLNRDDVYNGSFAEYGSDLIVISRYGFDIKASVKEKHVLNDTDLQGMHTWDDAFFFSPFSVPENFDITQIKQILKEKLI